MCTTELNKIRMYIFFQFVVYCHLNVNYDLAAFGDCSCGTFPQGATV